MQYKVLKHSLDGFSGEQIIYTDIKDVLKEVRGCYGWKNLAEMHKNIRKWAKKAKTGDVFCTFSSAVVAVGASVEIEQYVCPYCGREDEEGFDYFRPSSEDVDFDVDIGIEQKVECCYCGKEWIDTFTLTKQRKISS